MGMATVKNASSASSASSNSSVFTTAVNAVNAVNSVAAKNSSIVSYSIYSAILILCIAAYFYFQTSIQSLWSYVKEVVYAYYSSTTPSASVATSAVTDASKAVSSAITAAKMASSEITHGPAGPAGGAGAGPAGAGGPSGREDGSAIVQKILPSTGGGEVFNVAANRFTYYDAEPLCKAMGAELATYEQVKEAWSKGADWCNYGWVKGQMAVYPTAESTYAKLQSGPEEERMSCGTTGVNGGYFDNPEMRYGVTCYGKKPSKDSHDESVVAQGAPVSPDAVAFNQKVSKFKSEVDTIALSPFNGNSWNN